MSLIDDSPFIDLSLIIEHYDASVGSNLVSFHTFELASNAEEKELKFGSQIIN